MPIDLTPRFIQAARGGSSWSGKRFLAVMEKLVEVIDQADIEPDPASIDWSRSKNEGWGRVLDGHYVVALLRRDVPLAVVAEHYAGLVQSQLTQRGVEVVAAANFESRDYQIDVLQTLQAIPGFHWTAEFIDPRQISIVDLWWATI